MAEEKKEPWLNWMSLATVIFAVCATLSTFKGGSFSTQSVISQALASDEWAFYQATRTKRHIYEVQLDLLRLQDAALSANNPAAPAYQQKIADYEKQIKKYDAENADLSAKAQALEKQRDDAK